jgi:hypothetical protein
MNWNLKRTVPGGTLMNKKKVVVVSLIVLATLLLGACSAGAMPARQGSAETQTAAGSTQTEQPSAPTNTPAEPTATPTATVSPVEFDLRAAEDTATAYFAAVADGDSDNAANLLSRFSLAVFEMTHDDAVLALQTQKSDGIRWSNLNVGDVESFTDNTILVHVSYTQTTKTQQTTPTVSVLAADSESVSGSQTVEAIWPIRKENGEWLLNWNNIIDYKTLSTSAKTVSGITILPTELIRYTDRITLKMLIQNRTNDTAVFGQTNETLGTFYFNDETVIAEKTRWILNPLRTEPDATLEIKGLYTRYPDSVDIRTWNNYDVDPWYVFLLN